MKVKIRLQETSQAVIIDGVENTYTKGPFYCVYIKATGKVRKFPIATIFEVEEDYNNVPQPQILTDNGQK